MHGELIIAGKAHSEILAMKIWTRSLWYRMIPPDKREEAKRIVETVRRAKISASLTGRTHSEETKAKISAAMTGENNPFFGRTHPDEIMARIRAGNTGKTRSEETRAKISASLMGENNPNFGKTHTEESNAKRSVTLTGRVISKETRAKISAAWTPERRAKHSAAVTGNTHSEATRAKISTAKMGKPRSEETKAKISVARIGKYAGENHPRFNNWSSREPYCHLWDEPLRERCRNHYGRVCILSDTLRSVMGPESGLDDFAGHEIFDGRRLSVHHIRGNKMSGCDGTELALIPLQGKFNTTKFDGLKLEDHPFYITLFLLKDIERRHREEILELVQ